MKKCLKIALISTFLGLSLSAQAYRNVTILEFDSEAVSNNNLQDPRTLISQAVASETFSADGLFHFDKATLKDLTYQYADFAKLASIAKQGNYYVRVDAFADELGSDRYNLNLSKRRANAVKQYFAKTFGISTNRISATGWGERYPVVECDTSKEVLRNKEWRKETIECLKPNRRVTVSIVK